MKYRTITGELADMHPSVTPERLTDAIEHGTATSIAPAPNQRHRARCAPLRMRVRAAKRCC